MKSAYNISQQTVRIDLLIGAFYSTGVTMTMVINFLSSQGQATLVGWWRARPGEQRQTNCYDGVQDFSGRIINLFIIFTIY